MKPRTLMLGGSRFAVEGLNPSATWLDRLRLLKTNWWIHAAMLVGVAVGFFHGWLKLVIRSPITTFAVDIFLIIALLGIVVRKDARDRLLPTGAVGSALSGFYILCVGYLFLGLAIPGSPPLLLTSVALRGWCFATLMFVVGYHLIRSGDQLRVYFLWIVLLGLVTAIYGIRQTPEDVARIIQAIPELRIQYETQRYVDEAGNLQLRRFSTFISSGAFGGAMSSVAIIALAMFTDANMSKRDRWLFLIAAIPMTYAISLSGARSALISAGIGFLFLLIFRRSFTLLAVAMAVLVIGVALGSSQTGGGALDRIKTLQESGGIWSRFWIPTSIGVEYAAQNPMGGGLGKTGHLPAFLVGRSGYSDFVQADGDLGRLLIELGVPGLISYGWLLAAAGLQALRGSKQTAGTPNNCLALACSAMFVLSLITFPTGSPFVGIPMGLLVWFFFGATLRLAEQSNPALRQNANTVRGSLSRAEDSTTRHAASQPLPTVKRRRFLYAGASSTGSSTTPERRSPETNRSSYRRLFSRPPKES
jgi:hypothetical protein